MLHHKFLLAANSVNQRFIEKLQQYILLGRIQTREDWNVVLTLGAEDCATPCLIYEVSTANVSKQMYFPGLFQSGCHM